MSGTSPAHDSLEISIHNEIERIAAELHHRVRRPGLEALALEAGCILKRSADLPMGVDAVPLPNGVIVVRPHLQDSTQDDWCAYFGLSHWLLRACRHSAEDAWCLAWALARPSAVAANVSV